MFPRTLLIILGLLTAAFNPATVQATLQPLTSQINAPEATPVTTIGVWSPAYRTSNINNVSLTPNTTFNLDINVTEASSLSQYDMALVYDPTILQTTRIWFNDTIFSPNPATTFQINNGNIYFAVFSRTGGVNGTGTLAHLQLKVLALGFSGLDIDSDRIAPDAPKKVIPGCFRNTPERRVTPDFSHSPNPGPDETSAYMMGDVAVGLILPEGTHLNWTDIDLTATINGVKQGMAWWASQEPLAHLRFFFDIHAKVPISYEPIEMNEFEDTVWIHEAMTRLNYTQGDAYSQVRAYNNDIRSRFKTDWAFTGFVVESTAGPFASGGYAHAYLGGPWWTMSRSSSGAFNSGAYNVAVPAHETGHIFYATDEYDGSKAWSGYLNTPDYDGAVGIMNQNSFRVSTGTRRQIGWTNCDLNGILDILDTTPSVRLDPFPAIIKEASYGFTGAVVDIPHPRTLEFAGRDISINKIISTQYRLDRGEWANATALDGSFDNGLENFTLTLDHLTTGTHYLSVQATNTAGNYAVAEYSFTAVVNAGASPAVLLDSWTGTRNTNLGIPVSLVLKARGVNIRDAPVWLQVVYEARNLRTGLGISLVSRTVLLSAAGEVELSASFTPPNAAGRYEVTASLYYTLTDPAQSQAGWANAGETHFRLLVTASSQ